MVFAAGGSGRGEAMGDELSIAEINALWDKVSARIAPEEQTHEVLPAVQRTDPLYEMLLVEGDMLRRYERLSRRLGNRKASALTARLRENQLKLVRRMAAAVFLRSGKRLEGLGAEKICGDLMEQVRDYALWELRQAEAYRQYGLGAEPSLRDILFEAQKRKEENASLLSGIIELLVL